ncbi:Zinc finger BED domain-containing protein 1 [Orchesella cincta]|uniref:Zinc finger BED domain-containing protein 1 n=1 Tax=Orchesella cincta TaxID=48709 RepID=A0A1D2N4Y3_ORCCI|nr:Zinc finger BED domain-containing protein 1 [Orchesella cincta]
MAPKRKYRKRYEALPGAPRVFRVGRKTSVVWFYFKELPREGTMSKSQCRLCGMVFKLPCGSTTGMRGHLDRKHPGSLDQVLIVADISCKRENADRFVAEHANFVQPEQPPQAAHRPANRRGRRPVETPPPTLPIEKIENAGAVTAAVGGAIAEVGETEIFEEDDSLTDPEADYDCKEHDVSSSGGSIKNHVLMPGPPPEAYSILESEEATKSIVCFLAASLKPLQTVNEAGFRKMISSLNSAYLMQLCNGGSNILLPLIDSLNELYTESRMGTRQDLQHTPISLNLELWVKTNCEIYLLANANFVSQDWILESRFIGIQQLPETNLMTSTADLYAKINTRIEIMLIDLDLPQDTRIITAVTINTFPFIQQGHVPKILGVRTFPCFNQVLREAYTVINTCAKQITGCDVAADCTNIGKKILPAYKELKSHPGKLMESFQNFRIKGRCANLPLSVSMDTIDAVIKMQKPITDIVDSLLDEPVIPASTLLPLIFGIHSFFNVQVDTENSKWPPEQKRQVANIVSGFIQSSYNMNVDSVDSGDNILHICSFLDPRYNLQFLPEEHRQFVYDAAMEKLYEFEKETGNGSNTGTIISVRSENPEFLNGSSSDPLNTSHNQSSSSQHSSKLAAMLTKIMGRAETPAPGSKVQEELRNYVREPIAHITTDPYSWWNDNYPRYPTLSELAKKYLCIRGISVHTKYAFTSAGEKFFSSLSTMEPDFLERMLCVRKYTSDADDFSETVSSGHVVFEDHLDIKTEMVSHHQMMEEED